MADDFDVDDYRRMFGGTYLSAPTLGQPGEDLTFRIDRVTGRDVETPEGDVRRRLVVHLADAKPWLPCRTTAECMGAMWGPRVADWAGREITLFHDPTVRVGAKVVGGIRVRGAPDLPRPIEVEIPQPRRKPLKIRLVNTRQGQGQAQAPTLATLNLTRAGVDALLVSLGKPPATDAGLPAILTRLAASPEHLARARELSRAGTPPHPQPTPTAPADDDGPPDLE
jgi:hypothetical protein